MDTKRRLEEAWDAAYPTESGERLWPDEPVPMIQFCERFFVPGAAVLDLPCGDGKNIGPLAKLGPVVAADYSERGLALCEARRKALSLHNVVIIKADIFDTPFVDRHFESVFCCDLLGHLPDPELALAELHRITSPTGTLVVTLFSERDSVLTDDRMSRTVDGSYWFQGRWFFRFYSETAALELCRRAQFDVLAIEESSWWEQSHPGYREYRHQHSSWTLALRRVE